MFNDERHRTGTPSIGRNVGITGASVNRRRFVGMVGALGPASSPGTWDTAEGTWKRAGKHGTESPEVRKSPPPQSPPNARTELLPSGFPLKVRRRFQPVLLQNVGDGAARHLMAQIGERSLESRVAQPSFSVAMRITKRWILF